MFYQKQFDVSAWGKLYKKNTFEGLYFPMGYNFEDIPTIYKAFLKTDKIVYSSRKLYFYQVRDNSIENSEFNIKKMDCINTAKMMFMDIQSNYPELLKAARSRYVAANIHILAQIKKPIKEKSYICSNLRKERHKVLFDREATLRTRGACLISYLGFGTLTKLLNHMNRVKVKKMEENSRFEVGAKHIWLVFRSPFARVPNIFRSRSIAVRYKKCPLSGEKTGIFRLFQM